MCNHKPQNSDKTPWRLLVDVRAELDDVVDGGDPCLGGVGGVVAIFLMSIYPVPTGADEWAWVIVGDIPPAYLMLHQCNTPVDALKGYIAMMQEWVDLALDGSSSTDVIPVNIAPTPENARLLQTRLDLLTTTIVPWLEAGPTVH